MDSQQDFPTRLWQWIKSKGLFLLFFAAGFLLAVIVLQVWDLSFLMADAPDKAASLPEPSTGTTLALYYENVFRLFGKTLTVIVPALAFLFAVGMWFIAKDKSDLMAAYDSFMQRIRERIQEDTRTLTTDMHQQIEKAVEREIKQGFTRRIARQIDKAVAEQVKPQVEGIDRKRVDRALKDVVSEKTTPFLTRLAERVKSLAASSIPTRKSSSAKKGKKAGSRKKDSQRRKAKRGRKKGKSRR